MVLDNVRYSSMLYTSRSRGEEKADLHEYAASKADLKICGKSSHNLKTTAPSLPLWDLCAISKAPDFLLQQILGSIADIPKFWNSPYQKCVYVCEKDCVHLISGFVAQKQ